MARLVADTADKRLDAAGKFPLADSAVLGQLSSCLKWLRLLGVWLGLLLLILGLIPREVGKWSTR